MLGSVLIDLDQNLFSLINGELRSDLLDPIMIAVRNKYFWIPFYLFLLAFIAYNFKRKALLYILFLLLTVSISDYTSSSMIKPLIERPRPCHPSAMQDVNLLVGCGSGYSFTSSHATNHFAIAFFLIFTLPFKRKYIFAPLFLWAALISYAQVYVGVHYPLDVISGALLGTCIALIMNEIYNFTRRKIKKTAL